MKLEPAGHRFTMELAYDRVTPAAIGRALDDVSIFLMRRGWWRGRRTPVWFVGRVAMRIGSQYLRRGGQRVIIDGQLLTAAQVAKFDHGELWAEAPPSRRRRLWQRLVGCP